VTHDPREALLLADRIALLSARPSHIEHEIPVALPNRALAAPGLARLEAELIAAMCPPPSGGR
jgi:ABC-type nitrate/sulfonate/bicarbonate transport system ATPase subunit